MKRVVLALCGCSALMLSACADDYYGPRRFHDGPRGYAVYYDDFYGPVRDGRWGDDGYYYYRRGDRDDYVRDEGRHFRRDPYSGFHGVTYGASGAIGVGGSVGVGVGVRP